MNFYTKKSLALIQAKQSVAWQKILIIILAFALLIAFLNYFEAPIRNSFYVVSSPINQSFLASGRDITGFFVSLFNYHDIKGENTALNRDNQKLLSEISTLKESFKEHFDLKEAETLAKANNFNLVLVKTTGLDIQNDLIVIDKGVNDGVKENMPVISSQNALYGKISKVYGNFSPVQLISNKNSVLDVRIQNSDPKAPPVYGAVKGTGQFSVYLDLVSSEAQINEGDILTTSALDGIFPRNLLVGKVVSKDQNDIKPFQTANIQPFFDIKNIENVFIVTNYSTK